MSYAGVYTEYVEAYLEGGNAAGEGQSFLSCPYPVGILRTAWQEGWMEQHKTMYPHVWAIDPIITLDL